MADKTQKDKNKEAISNINKTGTVSGQKSGVTGSKNVVRTNVDETNLAGVNYGSTRSTPTSSGPTGINTQSYNLAGTNNIANAGGTVRNNTTTNQGPYVSSSTNKKYVTGNDISKYQSTLSSMADSSTKKANQILNTLGSTFKSIADLGKANQDYQNGLRQERLEIGRERSYAKADKDRADLTNSITQEDFNQFYNLDGSEVDFDGKIKDLTSKKSTLENIVNTATNEGQKNSAQAELDEVLAQIENFNLLKQKREALSETYTLESLKSEGDEQGYRSYRDMFSHKDDNLLQRAGSAVSHLAVETANEVPTMVDQFVYKAKATAVQQNLDLINQAYENKEIDIDQYVKALADIDERIKQAQDEYSDSTSMMIRDVVNQYGANTYYGANDIEKVLLQAGESTAQFLLHYVIGKGIASVAYKDKALIEAGKNFVLENYGENALAGLTDPDFLKYGVSALGGDIATISMSGVGMTEKINQLLDEGYDINTAYMNGLFTGLVSYATEKVGMDELVKTFGTKVSADILGKVIRSSVVSGFMSEGGEEFVEGLIDPFIDTITLGTDYKVNGNELLMAFMLGGFSGGAMAGGSVAINYATEAINVNRALKARTQNRATVNTLNRVGKLIIENRGEYNATKAEMDLLERNYSSMTEYQKEVYEGIKKFYEDGRRNYEAMSQTMGVELANDQVNLSSPEENDHTVIQTLESDFNQEAQMINTLDELQEDVNSKLDPIIDAELSVRNKTQQLLNDSGYNMDADLFNSLDSNLQNEALVALDFAKIKGLDVNITDDAGIKEILLNNSSKIQKFAKTHSEEETNALLQNIVDGTNGLRVGEGIVINANKNPVLSTLVHELTHGTESSALYDVLKDVVSNTMDNWDATVENKAQIYDNVQDFKNAEERRLNAEQEVVAETVEKNLGNEKFLNDLIRYDYSAFSRLWQNIKSLGDSSETTRIKNAFEKAFRDNYGQTGMRYSASFKANARENVDNYGQPINENMARRINGTKLTDGEGNPLRIFHTSGALFEEFDPTGTDHYRFGDKKVTYFSTDPVVSGSYANGDYDEITSGEDFENFYKAQQEIEDLRKEAGDKFKERHRLIIGLEKQANEAIKESGVLENISQIRSNIENNAIFNPKGKPLLEGENANWNSVAQDHLLTILDNIASNSSNPITKITSIREIANLASKKEFYHFKATQELADVVSPIMDTDLLSLLKVINDYESETSRLERERSEILDKIEELTNKLNNGKGKQYVGYGKVVNPYIVENESGIIVNWNSINDGDWKMSPPAFETVSEAIGDELGKLIEQQVDDLTTKNRISRFILDNVNDSIREYLIENPIALANYTNVIKSELSGIRGGFGSIEQMAEDFKRGFSADDGFSFVAEDADGNIYFTGRLETNDVVKAVLAINDFIDNKYDGVVFKNMTDSASYEADNIESDIIALFESNQFKLIGNENPTDDPRMRFSYDTDNLIKKATKELSTVKDSKRRVSIKAEVTQALKEINENGDVSQSTYEQLRQRVIESSLIKIQNDNYETAKKIREEMGWTSLPKKNWDVALQTLNDKFSIFPEDQFPSGYQDAKELVDNYLSSIGGKEEYVTPVQQGWMSQEEYEDQIDSAIKNGLDVLKYGSTESEIADINAVTDYLYGEDEILKTLAENFGKESVENVNSEFDSLSEEDLFGTQKDGKIKERNKDEFRILQEASKKIVDRNGWDDTGRYLDEHLQERLSGILRDELESRNYSDSNGDGLLKNTGDFKIFKDVDGQTFHDIFGIARAYLKFGELVDLHPVDTNEDWTGYNDTKNYLSSDGLSGFAITKDGDLISVFNLNRTKKGFLRAIAPFIKENAKTLDCYVLDKAISGTNLQQLYHDVFGFETREVVDYNYDYDHDGIGQRYNDPQIAFMYNPQLEGETNTKDPDDLNISEKDLKNYKTVTSYNDHVHRNPNVDTATGVVKPAFITELESTIDRTTRKEELEDGEKYAGYVAQQLDAGVDPETILEEVKKNPLENSIIRANYVGQVFADRGMFDEMYELAQWARDTDRQAGQIIESTKHLYDLKSTFSRAVYLAKAEQNMIDEYSKYKRKTNVEEIINDVFKKYGEDVINSKTVREFRAGLSHITREVRRLMPKTIFDRLKQFRLWAMLSGAKSPVGNFISNSATLGLYKLNGVNQAILESALKDVTIKNVDGNKTYNINKEERNATFGKNKETSKYNRKIADQEWQTLKKEIKSKYDLGTEDIPEIIKNNLKIDRKNKIQKSVDMVLDVAQGIQNALLNDAPFARVAFLSKFDELAQARGIDLKTIDKNSKTYDKLVEDAYKYAEEVVSHDETAISRTLANITRNSASNVKVDPDSYLKFLDEGIKWVKQKANKGEIGYKLIDNTLKKTQEWFAPFFKTNASLLKKSLQYSPLEIAQVINDYSKVKAGQMDLTEMVDHMAKFVTGSELYLLGMVFSRLGWLKWDKDDEDYSGRLAIKVPNTKYGYTIDFVDPVSTIFAKGVVLDQELSEEGVPFEKARKLWSDYETIFLSDELDMFSSLNDFIQTLKKVDKGEDQYGEYTLGDGVTDTAFSVLNSYIPAIIRDISRLIDPNKKVVYDSRNWKYLANRLMNSTPFRSKLVDKKDATGNTLTYTQPFTGNEAVDRTLTMFSKGKLVDMQGKAVSGVKETSSLGKEASQFSQMAQDFQFKDENGDGFSDAHWIRDSVPSNIYPAGEKTELNPEEKEKYGTTWTDTWTSGANYLLNNDEYKKLDYENQADIIYELQGFAREVIEADYCKDHDMEMTTAQQKASAIKDFVTKNGKVNGELLGLIALGNAKENKMANGGQRYVMAEQDENGKTIKNSRQLMMRQIYEENGVYEDILKAIENSDGLLEYADFGLGKTVVGYSEEKAKKSYAEIYGEVMDKAKTGKASKGKASKGKTKKTTYKGKTGGRTTLKTSSLPKSNAKLGSLNTTKIANNYFKAYANVFNRSGSKSTSSGGTQSTCPNCGARVSANASRCPNCGAKL